jgi:hypothetical protein
VVTERCIVCTLTEAAHPEVGGGYVPHPFMPADWISVPGYEGPDRRKLVRRMHDRVEAVERMYDRAQR